MMVYINPNDTPEEIMKEKPDLTGLNYWQARRRMRQYNMRLEAASAFQKSNEGLAKEAAEKSKALAATPAATPPKSHPAEPERPPQTSRPNGPSEAVTPLVVNARKRGGIKADTGETPSTNPLIENARRRAEAAKQEDSNVMKENPLVANARRRAENVR